MHMERAMENNEGRFCLIVLFYTKPTPIYNVHIYITMRKPFLDYHKV